MPYAQKKKFPRKKIAAKKSQPTVETLSSDDETVAVAVEPIDGEDVIAKDDVVLNEEDGGEGSSDEAEDADDQDEEDADATVVKEENSDLSSIYGLDDDQPVDMTKLDQKKSRGRWVLGVFLLVGLLAVVVYMGYRVFRTNDTKNGDVQLSLKTESRVASGDVVTVTIEYTNTKNVDIKSGTIEVFYPDGFQFQSSSPEPLNDRHRTWTIGNTQPGAGGKIRIVGQLVGAKNESKNFSTLFTYRPSNFSQDFQITAKTSTVITSSNIDLSVDAPAQVASDQEMTYTISYTNTSTLPLNAVKMQMVYPEGFTFISASESPWSENDEWRIDALQPNDKRTLTITGKLSGDSGAKKSFDFQLGVIEIDNSFAVQLAKTFEVVVVNPEVDLTLTAPTSVHAGDQVPFTVVIKNTSEAKLKDVQVRLAYTGALFTASEYTFDSIKELAANEEKTLTTQVTLLSDKSTADQQLTAKATITSARVNGLNVTFDNHSDITLKVAGNLTLIAKGRYFDDSLTKIGSGPIPPTVGQKTTYVVQWNLANQQNSMANVRVVTTLPSGVKWENAASSAIAYDSETRQVSYTKDTLAANATAALSFSVSVTPTAADVNKLLVVTNETTLTAKNSFTNEQVTQQIPRITTDLPGDEGASGKGVVIAK